MFSELMKTHVVKLVDKLPSINVDLSFKETNIMLWYIL